MTAREVLSALLDGESPAGDGDRAERHRAACPACAHWYAEAARLNRLLRLAPADDAGTDGAADLADSVLNRVRLPRRGRWRRPLRVALLLVAVMQLGIGLASLFTPLGMAMVMPDSPHMDHEDAAFNVAFGVALLLVGVNTRRAGTQLPVLGSFVLVLAVVSGFDFVDGAVGWARLATHVVVVVGALLVAALARGPHTSAGPTGEGAARPVRAEHGAQQGAIDQGPGTDDVSRAHPGPPAARKSA